MRQSTFKLTILKIFKNGIFWSVLLCVGVIVAISVSITSVSDTVVEQQKQLIEDALARATVQCYALEGSYPEDLQYLKDEYGFYHDDKYAVYYESYGANLFPEIYVFALNEEPTAN